jgi:cryptochrome
MQSLPKLSLYWFRKSLRLHDNPGLLASINNNTTNSNNKNVGKNYLVPFFIMDPKFAPTELIIDRDDFTSEKATFTCSHNRWCFLLESLSDLDKSMKSIESKLNVFYGEPTNTLESLLFTFTSAKDSKEFCDVNAFESISLYYEFDSEPYAILRDEAVEKICLKFGVSVKSFISHTLYDPKIMNPFFNSNPSTHPTYKSFLNHVSKMKPENVTPCENVTREILKKKNCFNMELNDESKTRMNKYVHSKTKKFELNEEELNELVESEECEKKICKGGETEALKRMKEKLSNISWVCSFEKPKTSPNSLEPSTTLLSPYLKFGCLSVRTFFQAILTVFQSSKSKHTQPPESLLGQLYWREFFYHSAYATPNFHQIKGNKKCKQILWDNNKEFLTAWATGKTGFPFIDAIMTQLRLEGWIHHLARHMVACFLTRGHLYQSWEKGAYIFEQYLLDADYSLNAANWQWLSCSAFFSAYFRVYGPVSFGKKTDPNGDYIRKYIPVLKDFPKQFIYEPWNAPLATQKKFKCIIGKDYPKPIIDEAKARMKNLDRIAKAMSSKPKEEENDTAMDQDTGLINDDNEDDNNKNKKKKNNIKEDDDNEGEITQKSKKRKI